MNFLHGTGMGVAWSKLRSVPLLFDVGLKSCTVGYYPNSEVLCLYLIPECSNHLLYVSHALNFLTSGGLSASYPTRRLQDLSHDRGLASRGCHATSDNLCKAHRTDSHSPSCNLCSPPNPSCQQTPLKNTPVTFATTAASVTIRPDGPFAQTPPPQSLRAKVPAP